MIEAEIVPPELAIIVLVVPVEGTSPRFVEFELTPGGNVPDNLHLSYML